MKNLVLFLVVGLLTAQTTKKKVVEEKIQQPEVKVVERRIQKVLWAQTNEQYKVLQDHLNQGWLIKFVEGQHVSVSAGGSYDRMSAYGGFLIVIEKVEIVKQ